MKSILVVLMAISLAGCSLTNSGVPTARVPERASQLSDEERHRLYSAALAASESPLESDLFRQVCQQIGIYDPNGKPNEQYMAFVSQHVDWSMKSESDQFRREIDSKEKARDYVEEHLSTR